MTSPHQSVHWLFGRGLSIGCNLSWAVPAEWNALPREDQINRIKEALRKEMAHSSVDSSVIKSLLGLLGQYTTSNWSNLFITTNWDYLLQREILSLDLSVKPPWLSNSHVFHLNGTIEELQNNEHRSPFVLEQDSAAQRIGTTEGDIAFNHMAWNRMFVVVGMSFECEIDKFLLTSLSLIEDDMPIGESEWVVVNPDSASLKASCARLQSALPRSKINSVQAPLSCWLEAKLPELQKCGAIAF